MIIGLYRHPSSADASFLPYTYTCPKPDAVLRAKDRLFVFCCPLELESASEGPLMAPLALHLDGEEGLAGLDVVPGEGHGKGDVKDKNSKKEKGKKSRAETRGKGRRKTTRREGREARREGGGGRVLRSHIRRRANRYSKGCKGHVE